MPKPNTLLIAVLLLFAQIAAAQRTISGRVVSANDQSPLGEVTVHIKGTKATTVTKTDGTFSIVTDEANPVLEFTSVRELTEWGQRTSLIVEPGAITVPLAFARTCFAS